MDSSPDTLNPIQRELYEMAVQQYLDELAGRDVKPLRINLDGVAGSGKTYVLLKICSRLQELALAANRPSPVFRCAPTGIAAFNILGKTLHSLLRVPVKGRPFDSSNATLLSLQSTFRGCQFLIIDEKSMIPLKTLAIMDQRLRQIFPEKQDEFFGGINVFLCGDFFQLPPVGGKALYSRIRSGDAITMAGQNAYLSFDRTVRLTEVMRQQGENDEAVLFRTALTELRSDILSETSWRLLCTRARNELSPEEVATFDSALRLYFTNNEVEFYNHGKLKSLKTPVKKVVGRHRGANASKATEEQADNLSAEIFLAVKARVILRKNLWVERGLVNGSMGTVEDLVWKPGQDTTKELPWAIMVKFDGYNGPVVSGSSCVPVFLACHKFDMSRKECSRTQFPLQLAYAITVHKSQGLTLARAVLNLNQRQHCLGLAYVAVSRVKALTGLMLDCSFDFEKFHRSSEPSANAKDREIDRLYREKQILK